MQLRGAMRRMHTCVVLFVLLVLGLSPALPAEDLPGTAYDESETQPYESSPSISNLMAETAFVSQTALSEIQVVRNASASKQPRRFCVVSSLSHAPMLIASPKRKVFWRRSVPVCSREREPNPLIQSEVTTASRPARAGEQTQSTDPLSAGIEAGFVTSDLLTLIGGGS